MMKRFATLLFLLALLPAAAYAQSFSALLSGANEVPAADADGTGLAVVTFSGTTVNYSVLVQNINTPTMAHIHRGAAGINGPVVIGFDVNTLSGGSAAGVDQGLINEILANPSGFYVNVHTSDFPGGAIRGQLFVATEAEGSRTSFVPVVGKVTGANNTNFVTDVRIVNRGAVAANVTLDFFASSAAGQTAPSVTKTTTVAPGEQKVLNDLVGTTLATSGLGGLRITSDQNVLTSSRVINDLRSTNLGTAGFAVDARETGDTSGTIAFLASNTDFRTNMGYFNPNSTAVNATFVAHRTSDGSVLGSNTLAIPGFAMVQQPVFSLISSVPASDQTQNDYYVTWTSSAPLFVYGAVTDNKTGDAVLNQ
jgi:CHRD domain-containing protein